MVSRLKLDQTAGEFINSINNFSKDGTTDEAAPKLSSINNFRSQSEGGPAAAMATLLLRQILRERHSRSEAPFCSQAAQKISDMRRVYCVWLMAYGI
jgi:hypothetical protein